MQWPVLVCQLLISICYMHSVSVLKGLKTANLRLTISVKSESEVDSFKYFTFGKLDKVIHTLC